MLALFFAVIALSLLTQKVSIPFTINNNFVLVVNLILFTMALFNFKRISHLDLNNPNAMVRSVMTGTMLKFIVFGGGALWYATQKKAPIGTNNLFIAMGLYLLYTWIEIGWTKVKKDA
jgi:hypothetical protein